MKNLRISIEMFFWVSIVNTNIWAANGIYDGLAVVWLAVAIILLIIQVIMGRMRK